MGQQAAHRALTAEDEAVVDALVPPVFNAVHGFIDPAEPPEGRAAHWVLVEPSSEEDPAGLSNYADVLRSCVWEAARVTVTSAASSIACGLVLGTAMALALNLDFNRRTTFRSAMMIPMVITPSVIGIF